MHDDALRGSVIARRWLATVVLLVVAALALAVTLVLVWRSEPASEASSTVGDAEARQLSGSYLDLTRSAAAATTAFLEVDHRRMDAVTARVLDSATGDFAEQYAAGRDRLVAEVERSRAVVTSGSPVVAVERAAAARAEVLVAVDSALRDRDTGDGVEERKHRLRLVLERVGQDWAVSGLEFVP